VYYKKFINTYYLVLQKNDKNIQKEGMLENERKSINQFKGYVGRNGVSMLNWDTYK